MLQAAETLADKADSARDWIGGWQDTLQSDVRSEIDSYASRATDWASSLGAGRIAFVRASRDALGSPTWEVHFRTDSATESRLRHPMAKHRSKRIQC